MFIEYADFKRFLLAPEQRNVPVSSTIVGNIALRWSAVLGFKVGSINIRLLRSSGLGRVAWSIALANNRMKVLNYAAWLACEPIAQRLRVALHLSTTPT